MEAEARKRAFEAFFTTKEVTGTGLGLWVSPKSSPSITVRSSCAAATASSGRPSGTVFQFFIPDDPTLLAATDATQEATVNAPA